MQSGSNKAFDLVMFAFSAAGGAVRFRCGGPATRKRPDESASLTDRRGLSGTAPGVGRIHRLTGEGLEKTISRARSDRWLGRVGAASLGTSRPERKWCPVCPRLTR